MQNTDFVIENGVLTKYTGPGGDVAIPEGVTEIGKSAFYDCAGLTSVTIPEGVTVIGDYAFRGCTSLTSVTIPASVTEIAENAFDYGVELIRLSSPNSGAQSGDSRGGH